MEIIEKSIDVIIPCYNQEKYILECINSVLENITELDITITIVDDYSTDNSVEIMQREYGKVVNIIRNTINKKLPATRNVGLKYTNSSYIICLDGDDKIPINYIQKNYENILDNNIDISYTSSQCFEKSDILHSWGEFDINTFRNHNYINASAMFKRSMFDVIGGFSEDMIYGWEDYDFWLKAVKYGFKPKKCKETNLYWRMKFDDINMSIETVTQHKYEILNMLRNKHKSFYDR